MSMTAWIEPSRHRLAPCPTKSIFREKSRTALRLSSYYSPEHLILRHCNHGLHSAAESASLGAESTKLTLTIYAEYASTRADRQVNLLRHYRECDFVNHQSYSPISSINFRQPNVLSRKHLNKSHLCHQLNHHGSRNYHHDYRLGTSPPLRSNRHEHWNLQLRVTLQRHASLRSSRPSY